MGNCHPEKTNVDRGGFLWVTFSMLPSHAFNIYLYNITRSHALTRDGTWQRKILLDDGLFSIKNYDLVPWSSFRCSWLYHDHRFFLINYFTWKYNITKEVQCKQNNIIYSVTNIMHYVHISNNDPTLKYTSTKLAHSDLINWLGHNTEPTQIGERGYSNKINL